MLNKFVSVSIIVWTTQALVSILCESESTVQLHSLIVVVTSIMMTSSNGNILHVTGPLRGNSPVTNEFPSQRPVTRSFDVFFDLRLIKRLSEQSWGWWFETQSRSLWRHCNERLSRHSPSPKDDHSRSSQKICCSCSGHVHFAKECHSKFTGQQNNYNCDSPEHFVKKCLDKPQPRPPSSRSVNFNDSGVSLKNPR